MGPSRSSPKSQHWYGSGIPFWHAPLSPALSRVAALLVLLLLALLLLLLLLLVLVLLVLLVLLLLLAPAPRGRSMVCPAQW